MTIFLPQDPILFLKAFEETCDRILQSNLDEVFYALLVQLISQMRENSLFKNIISQVEAELLKKQIEHSKISLDFHEYNWKKLWQYHRRSYQHRRELVRIKRIITCPRETSSSPLHIRLGFAMREFRYHSPFFYFVHEAPALFRKAQSDMVLGVTFAQYFSSSGERKSRKIIPLKLKKKDKRANMLKKILAKTPKPSKQNIRGAEPTPSLLSPLAQDLEHKFGIPGQNNDQKRRNMKTLAETDFRFCWERLQSLEQCYNVQSKFPPLKRYLGRWNLIREKAWNTAWERCEQEALQLAHMAFRQKLSPKSNDSIDAFLSSERQIYRRDYEGYLCSLKYHVHIYLRRFENLEMKTVGTSEHALPGTLKGNFVIDLALKFWKTSPFGKRDEPFEYYQCNCPPQLQLRRDRWDQIIRKNKLDPRPKKEQKRGRGKKTCKS
jgi:hypothetical protein